MKITRMTDRMLTPADVAAIVRMRRSLVDCQFAYLSDQVAVMLITEETDPAALRDMAREQMDGALSCMPDYSCCSAWDGAPMTLLQNGCVCTLAPAGDTDDSLWAHVYLRNVGLAACELLPVLAIVTGEDADALEAAPGTIDEAAPARDYIQEMTGMTGDAP